ncbi:uncharacterized protein J4E92_008447 [Alternaria infectoria]|uniref:uncharacterized protein n=1 Tax=Alternaria infectoria TaxID=45303 RepID=UPI00221E7A34|nr:uncharacterized protein J4E92_008447 [Alternaria infectoria]KAI4920803.1 hypothetical protein J4E92_008447 [Alternaria infectoria]
MSAETVPSHPTHNASDATPAPAATSSTTHPTIPADDLSRMVYALDKASIINEDPEKYGHNLLIKLAVEDPAITATIKEAHDAHVEEEKNRVVEFQDVIDQLRNSIPKSDETMKPEKIPVRSYHVEKRYRTCMYRICDRTYEYSSFGTKKNALDAWRNLLVLLVQIPDKRLRAAVIDRINLEEACNFLSHPWTRGMEDIVHSLTPAQREEVCFMPVDGATVTYDKSGRSTGAFKDKFTEVTRELEKADCRIQWAAFWGPLMVWPVDPEIEEMNEQYEMDMEGAYEDGDYDC